MSKSSAKNSILLQGSILAAASLIVRLIGLVYRIPLNRILGDEAMGYYSTAFEFYNLALLLSSYSLPLAVSKLVSTREIKGQHRNSRKVFYIAMAFGAFVGAIATAVVYFGADWYARLNKTELVAIPLRVLAPTIFVFSVMGVIRGYFQGHNNMVPTAFSQVIEQIVNAAVSIGAALYMVKRYANDDALAGYGAAGGTWGTFIGAVAAAITLFIIYMLQRPLFKKLYDSDETDYVESNITILRMIVFTVVPVIISQTVYQISGTIDVTIFHRILSDKGFDNAIRSSWWGIYGNKYKLLTNVPIAIASAMGTAIVPGLIGEYAKNNFDEVRRRIASAVKFNMILAFPCAAGLTVLARPILLLLFGDGSAVSSNMLLIGSISVVFFALSTVTNGILQGVNRLHLPVLHSAVALVLHLILLVVLLLFTDLNPYALVICNVFFAFVVCVLNWRSIGRCLNYKQEVRRTFLCPLFASIVMGAAAYGVHFALDRYISNAIATLAAIGVAVVVYFLVLIAIRGVNEEELYAMPKGRAIVRVLKMLRILR